MAVDQAAVSTHPDFIKYLLTVNNGSANPIHHHMNNLYSNHSNVTNSLAVGALTPAPANESLLLPCYGFNDVAGKFYPAVKDDSSVTFNNSLVPPSASRKRHREQAVLPAASGISGTALPSLLATNSLASTCSSIIDKESNGFSFLGDDISVQIMQQQLEVDRLITQHVEKMKIEIEERKKHQLRRIMAAIEEATAKRMREKEEQIYKIGKVNVELEERVKTLCIENQLWRDLAQTNGATANALRSNLEQVLQQIRDNAAGEQANDAVSCCGSSGTVDDREIRDDGEQRLQRRRICKVEEEAQEDGKKWVYRGENNTSNKMNVRMCRNCGEGESSVLLLPCRHLCLCTSCGPTVNACPICNSVKKASVHVNLS